MEIENQYRSSSKTPAEIADSNESAIEIQTDSEKLRAYMQARLALSDQLRVIREALRRQL